MQVVTNKYPHIWPYLLNFGKGSAMRDIRVRKALNLAIDRDSLVGLLGGLAMPAKGMVYPGHPWFGKPGFDLVYDPAQAKALLAEAGYGLGKRLKITFAISTAGSGLQGAVALNVSSPSSDVGVMARYFAASSFSPAGFNWEHWKDDQFEQALAQLSNATDPGSIGAAFQRAHERMVDDPPWLYIVHDLNPRAMSKRVHGFVPVQSRFVDLTAVSLE